MENSVPFGMKWCCRCHHTKDIKEFGRQKRSSDDRLPYCKICARMEIVKEIIPEGHKKCIGCHEIKDIQEFHSDSSRDDGRSYYCKPCTKAMYQGKQGRAILKRGTKRCSGCGRPKKLSEFWKKSGTRDGLYSACIECCSERKKINNKRWNEENKEHRQESMHKNRVARLYNLSDEEYETLHATQTVCNICGRPEQRRGKKMLSVDHNHTTGKVRGLLCGNCNNGLGYFEDNIERMSKAIEYLKAHE